VRHDFTEGEAVRISKGTLEGLRGVIVKIKGQHKLVISIHALHYNLSIDIDPAFVEVIKEVEE
jgi:transcription antitermination factor NusG